MGQTKTSREVGPRGSVSSLGGRDRESSPYVPTCMRTLGDEHCGRDTGPSEVLTVTMSSARYVKYRGDHSVKCMMCNRYSVHLKPIKIVLTISCNKNINFLKTNT